MRTGAADTTPATPGSSSARRSACSLSAGPAKDGLLSRDAACTPEARAQRSQQSGVPLAIQTQHLGFKGILHGTMTNTEECSDRASARSSQ